MGSEPAKKPAEPKAFRIPDSYWEERKKLPKVKTSLYLTVAEFERLEIHAMKARTDHSVLLAKLVVENLRRYVVSDHRKEDGEAAQAEPVSAPETLPMVPDVTSTADTPSGGGGEGESSPPALKKMSPAELRARLPKTRGEKAAG